MWVVGDDEEFNWEIGFLSRQSRLKREARCRNGQGLRHWSDSAYIIHRARRCGGWRRYSQFSHCLDEEAAHVDLMCGSVCVGVRLGVWDCVCLCLRLDVWESLCDSAWVCGSVLRLLL